MYCSSFIIVFLKALFTMAELLQILKDFSNPGFLLRYFFLLIDENVKYSKSQKRQFLPIYTSELLTMTLQRGKRRHTQPWPRLLGDCQGTIDQVSGRATITLLQASKLNNDFFINNFKPCLRFFIKNEEQLNYLFPNGIWNFY